MPIAEQNERTLEAQELPELIHGADTPLAGLLDTHDFDQPQDRRSSTTTESSRRMGSCRLQDIG